MVYERTIHRAEGSKKLQQALEFGKELMVFLNLLLAVAVVFFERKSPKSVWAWLLLLFFIPVVGFVFYLLLGTDMRKKKMFRMKEVEDNMCELLRRQEYLLKTADVEAIDSQFGKYTDLVLYNIKTSGAILTDHNDVDIFTDGNELFDAMLEDMKRATEFIHIQYYIIRDDAVFERLVQVLRQKATQGVQVRILYDGMGCRSVNHRFWRKLRDAGIETAEFFPALFRRLHLRINYRNHRKIVVIDNKVAYVGGFNIGQEYVGLDESFGYWRDTHLRMVGTAVLSLQFRFLLDWNYASGQNLLEEKRYYDAVVFGERDFCKVQVISGGPDTGRQQIRDNYLRLIHKAKKVIYIQTPYFIPDEAILDSLLLVIRSGVEVNIMIPCKPDHMFVYWATYSYIGDLVMAGAKCYTYDNGFLHAKGMVVDGTVLCYGTANMDIRSFSLNFEVNVVVYDERKAEEMEQCFLQDLERCTRISRDMYAGRSIKIRLKEQICRLLSPLL